MSDRAADRVFRGRRVVFDDGTRPAAVHVDVDLGRITAITDFSDVPANVPIVDAGECAILPGLVDCHVHVNEPGRTEWEGFETATCAAAAGGITALVDMPLNAVPATTTEVAFETKLKSASGHCAIDVGFWGGLVPGNADELRPLIEAGVLGFKCFLIDSGVEEFPSVDERDLRRSLGTLANLDAVLLVHAELPGPIAKVAAHLAAQPKVAGAHMDRRSYGYHLASRPKAAENEAVELIVRLAREFRSPLHVVHHSSSEAIPALEAARYEGLPVTVETCPHYLSFVAEEIPDGATEFKCTPPIRERANQNLLWDALRRRVIDAVVSDHSPCSPDLKALKEGDFEKAWGGIASLELTLSATWTHASARGFALHDVVRWMARAPAEVARISDRKGRIAGGFDADFVFFSPEATFEVRPEALHSRHRLTPYAGRTLKGVVEETYLRGECVYRRTQSPSGTAAQPSTLSRRGTFLFRGRR